MNQEEIKESRGSCALEKSTRVRSGHRRIKRFDLPFFGDYTSFYRYLAR
ncbi:MAG: hypothetical protein GX614_07500 [Sandaracinaceae bacterium]|nr:hypothetical protein [Sandaracinaceae bacterium]